MNIDSKYMNQAIRLARYGAGWVNPNPMVGALLVHGDRVIGSGYHEYFGGAHAEVNAFDSVTPDDRHLIRGATLYVTLEPCSHYGKTPPCTDLVIGNGIGRVVVGMKDPNPLVDGNGIELLRNHGIEVVTGCEETAIRKQNEIFITYITTEKPFVVLKSAMTTDGKIATVTNASRWITGENSRRLVHKMRQQFSAVMVGIDTVHYDDPLLNIRLKGRSRPSRIREGMTEPAWKNPLKIITDSQCRISLDAKVLTHDPQLTIIATTNAADRTKIKEIERLGAQVLICPERNNQVDLLFLIQSLGSLEIDSVMIEGGSTLAFSAIREGVVDKVMTFIAPKILGGSGAPTPVGGPGIERMEDAIELSDVTTRRVGKDLLMEGYINRNPKT